MREWTFVHRRRPGWKRLETLLQRVERGGLRRLGGEDVAALGREYRCAASDLATARTRGYDATTIDYLNRLVARAHARVYVEGSTPGWSLIVAFFAVEFPSEVRRSWREIGACAVLFILAATVAYALVGARPLDAYALVPSGEIPLVRKSLHDSNFAFDRTFSVAMSSLIITNNIQVAALAVAGGMTLGIGTLWAILNNGLMLGALGALFATKGFGLDFWATIAPHGVLELSAIQIAGGAGLLLARAIVAPGPFARSDALRRNGRRAATLLVGVASMLVLAGTIEGFFTPLRTPIVARIAVAVATAALLVAYFTALPAPSRRDTRPTA